MSSSYHSVDDDNDPKSLSLGRDIVEGNFNPYMQCCLDFKKGRRLDTHAHNLKVHARRRRDFAGKRR